MLTAEVRASDSLGFFADVRQLDAREQPAGRRAADHEARIESGHDGRHSQRLDAIAVGGNARVGRPAWIRIETIHDDFTQQKEGRTCASAVHSIHATRRSRKEKAPLFTAAQEPCILCRTKPMPPRIAAFLLMAAAAGACRTTSTAGQPPIVQPGAPGQSSHEITAAKAADLSKVQSTPADVKFMQGMIAHHAQAIEMTNLLATRTENEDMRKLARRIEISQADEIGMMQGWLRSHGQEVPSQHAHHMMRS